MTELPYIDEHVTEVAASPERTWEALSSLGVARSDRRSFHTVRSEAPRDLLLAGSHPFSRYTLEFVLEPLSDGAGTCVRAITHAEFPGPHGFAYRTAVIRTRFHVLAMRKMLRDVRRRAETREG